MVGRHGAIIALARSATFTHWHGIQMCRVVPTRRVGAAQPGVTMGDGRGKLPIRAVIATTPGDWRLTLKTLIAGISRRVLARDRRIVTAWRRHLSTAGAGMGDGRIYASYDGGDTWQQLPLRGEGLPSVSAMVCVK